MTEMSMARPSFFRKAYHNMRNPLVAVKGYAALMLDGCGGDLSDEHREWVEDMRRNCDHLLDIINALSELAYLEAGLTAESREELDVGEALQAFLDDFAPLPEERGVRLERTLPEERLTAFVDRHLLLRALAVVMRNAVAATPPGGAVHVSCADEGARVRFSIRDEGQGLTQEECAALLQGFHQGDGGEDGPSGTGVGMVLAARIAERFGGAVTVEPASSRGAGGSGQAGGSVMSEGAGGSAEPVMSVGAGGSGQAGGPVMSAGAGGSGQGTRAGATVHLTIAKK